MKQSPRPFNILSEAQNLINILTTHLSGNLKKLDDYLEQNNKNIQPTNRDTKSHLNFEERNIDVFKRLINENANEISTDDKLSALEIALSKRQTENYKFDEIIKKLGTCDDLIIRVCENANLEYFNALTDNGNIQLTKSQIKKIIDHRDSEGKPIFNNDFVVKNLDFFKAMVKAGMQNSLIVKDSHTQRTILHKAIIDGDLNFAKALIEAGGKELLNSKDKDGRTALHYACIKENLDLADKLIEAGGKELLNSKDKDGRTALHHVCFKGNFDLADKLIEAGGKELLNSKDKNGRTALHDVCSDCSLIYKRIEFINKLIENPDLEFCKDSQVIPYNASDHITNQILAVENIVISKIYEIKTKKGVKKFYFSGIGLGENLQVMSILNDFKSGKDSPEIKGQIKVLDQSSREIILKYPIDKKLIETETKLINELKQIRTKLIKKEKGEDLASAQESKQKPSHKPKPVSCCWSMFSCFKLR